MHRFLIIFLAVALMACQQKPVATVKATAYFDLKGYMQSEISRLNRQHPIIGKTVSANGKMQTKKLRIENWEKELELFLEADMNKKAWVAGFNVKQCGDTTFYQSTEEKIPVKELRVVKDSAVKSIRIVLLDSNYLYRDRDTLIYVPNKTYSISASQKVQLNKGKRYKIEGIF